MLGASGTGLAVLALVTAGVYVVPLRRSLATLRRMGDGAATPHLTADTVGVTSAAGSVTLPWATVTRVEAHPDVWLLVYSSQQYSVLPAANLTAEARAFVAERVRAAGGTVGGAVGV